MSRANSLQQTPVTRGGTPDSFSDGTASLSEPLSSDDSEDGEEEPADFGRYLDEQRERSTYVQSNRMPRTDADSLVGGESLGELYEGPHPIADINRTAAEQETQSARIHATDGSDYNHTQKVFSFSLPFGGLSNIKSNFYKQFQAFKQDSNFQLGNNNNQAREEVRVKLERQESITTVDEAIYFKHVKHADDVRIRAMKHSFAANLTDILPDFIHTNTKEKEPCESIYNDIDGNIVILGGFRGSTLRETKTNRRVWIPFKAGFRLRKASLLLGPTKEDELNASKHIYSDGILKNVGPIDICKKLIKKLSSNPKTNVKEFGYDWRLSGDLLSKQLEEFLLEIYKLTGKPTLVIAHSMGGLIAHGTMQRNPKLFRSIVYVGSPSECLNVLGPVRFGDSVLLSDKILTYETNFMMRSGFNFLPLSGRIFVNKDTNEFYDLDYFDADTWVEYNLNPLVAKARKVQELGRASSPLSDDSTMYNVSNKSLDTNSSFPRINNISSKIRNYKSMTISRKNKPNKINSVPVNTSNENDNENINNENTSQNGSSSGSGFLSLSSVWTYSNQRINDEESFSFLFTQAYNYLSESLKLAKAYMLGLEFKEDLACEYPPLAVVYGNTVPSVRGSTVRSEQDIKDGNYYEFFYGHGDGVVHQKWLMPEDKGFHFYDNNTGEGEIVGKFSSACGHVNLMTDFKAMGNALYAVWEAEKVWGAKKIKQRKKKHRFTIGELSSINENN